MKKFLFSLAAVFCCTLMAFTLASCGDDDDNTTGGPYEYKVGFTRVEGSNVLGEMGAITDVFEEELGVEDSGSFTYKSDKEVAAACKGVKTRLDAMTLSGTYTVVVQNRSNLKYVFTWSN